VEDNPINQEVAREILEGRGVTVDLAVNGGEAVERVTSSGVTYDAVFMDVQMPVMDGLEATRRIRTYMAFDSLPIIAMTASAMASDRDLCFQAGMNDQVNKPIDVPELFATLRRWARPESFTLFEAAGKALVEDEEPGLLEHIHGIDVPRALQRLGNTFLLRKLLISFRNENMETMKNLRAALAQGDNQLAQRIVHTVKGVGGNLCATGLSAAALSLEQAMKGADADAQQSSMAELEEAKVETIGESNESPPEELLINRERIVPLVRELAALLEANNLTALNVWEQLKPLIAGVNRDKLDSTINGLNFKDGGMILVAISEDMGIELP
jgi:CheY-like chemotaxis protein